MQYLVSGIVIAMFVSLLSSFGYTFKNLFSIDIKGLRKYIREFYQYTHPLFIYSLISVLANIIDRCLLQAFGGSVEQGFYGFSFQLGALCFLFSGAMTPLLTRELSIAFSQQDKLRMQDLFQKYTGLSLLQRNHLPIKENNPQLLKKL